MPAGAPTKYDPDIILPKMAEAIEKGMYLEQLPKHLGVNSRTTIYNWMDEHPEFLNTVEQMVLACDNRVIELLDSHASKDRPGNTGVAIFIAKNVLNRGLRATTWRDRQEVEQTVKGDASITVNLGGARPAGELDAGNA